jgi:hypothetical protein
VNNKTEIFVAEGLSEGDKIRFTRLSKHLRQIDVASQAHCQPFEVTALEKGRHIRKSRKYAILKVLGLLTPEEDLEFEKFLKSQSEGDASNG